MLSLLLFVCALFPLYACDEQPVQTDEVIQQKTNIHFEDNSDIVLTYGKEGEDCASFVVKDGTDGYLFSYDHNIIKIGKNKIYAKGLGNTTLVVYDNNSRDSINIIVRSLPFCNENISVQDVYVFDINGASKTIAINNLNSDYGYDIQYSTSDDIFEVNNSGLVTPKKCGTGVLNIKLACGLVNGLLQYTTLTTVINVVDTPSMTISLTDNENNLLDCVNNQYVLYAMPAGSEYNIVVNYPEDISYAYCTTNLSVVNLGEKTTTNNQIKQPIVVNQKTNFDIRYAVNYSVYNYDTIVYSQTISVSVFMYIINFDIVITNTINQNTLSYTNNTINLYLLKDSLTAKVDAAADGIYQDINIAINTGADTDGLYTTQITDNISAVSTNNNQYLIRPTQAGNITFVLTATNGGYQKTFNIVVNNLSINSVSFCNIDETLYVGTSLNILPTISPAYAPAVVQYVFDNNFVSIENGEMTTLATGNCDVVVSAGSFSKTYHLSIIAQTLVSVYATTQDIDGFDGFRINYQIGDGTNFAPYNQEVQLTLYAQDDSVLVADNTNIIVNTLSHAIEIYVAPSVNYFRAVLYSAQYDIYSSPLVWTRD